MLVLVRLGVQGSLPTAGTGQCWSGELLMLSSAMYRVCSRSGRVRGEGWVRHMVVLPGS